MPLLGLATPEPIANVLVRRRSPPLMPELFAGTRAVRGASRQLPGCQRSAKAFGRRPSRGLSALRFLRHECEHDHGGNNTDKTTLKGAGPDKPSSAASTSLEIDDTMLLPISSMISRSWQIGCPSPGTRTGGPCRPQQARALCRHPARLSARPFSSSTASRQRDVASDVRARGNLEARRPRSTAG